MKSKRYLMTVAVLLAIDVLVAGWFGYSEQRSAGETAAMVAHALIGLWTGLILDAMTRPAGKAWRFAIGAYCVLLALTLVSMTMLLVPVQWTLTLLIAFKHGYVDAAEGVGDGRVAKGRWPLWVSAGLLFGVVLVNFLMALADKSEFGGLGLMMVHLLFISPFFIVAPALLRTPADRRTRPAVIRIQYLLYALLALSWVLLFL